MAVDTFTYLRQIGFSGTLAQMAEQLRRDTTKKWHYDVPYDLLTYNVGQELARIQAESGKSSKSNSLSVSDYGAVGGDTYLAAADETAAIQAAVTYATANGRELVFPAKFYKITAPIVIAQTHGWILDGRMTTITQATLNTPFFRLTKEDTWGWEIKNFKFTGTNGALATHTNSIAILLDPDTFTGHGFYHFRIVNTWYDLMYSGVGMLTDATVANCTWGLTISTITGGPYVYGPLINLLTVAGSPRITIEHFYARRDQGVTPAMVIVGGCLLVNGWEVNQGTDTQLLVQNCSESVFNHVRIETLNAVTDGISLFDFQNTNGVINSITAMSVTWNTGGGKSANVINAANGSTLVINTPRFQHNTITSGSVYVLHAGGSNFVEFNGYTVSGTGPTSINAPDGTGTKVIRSNNHFGQGVIHGRSLQPSASGDLTLSAKSGDIHTITLVGACTSSAITNPTAGQVLAIDWTQGGTGSYAYAWPTNCKFAGGSAPTPSTSVGYTDSVTFQYDGTNWRELSRSVGVR